MRYVSIISVALLGLLVGCNHDELADFSGAKIEYRVVSLKDSARRPLIQTQFDSANQCIKAANGISKSIPQTPVSWAYFDAIRGANVDQNILVQDGYYRGSGLNPGELGLVMTTTDLILPFAMNNASDNMLVVLEDDVIIPADIDLSFRMALKQVPSNWDILFLGCFQNAMVGSGGVVRGPFYPRNLSIDEGFKNNLCSSESLIEIPGTPWKGVLSCTTGTWAYALRKNSADKISGLLNQMKPFHEPIDVMYRNMFENRKINVYCLNPELIRPNYALPSFLR